VPFARPLVFFGADVFSDRQLALEMESRARKISSTKLVAVGSPIHSRDVRQCRGSSSMCPGGPPGFSGLADLRGAEHASGPQKETPAVGDMTAGALSRRSIRHGHEGEP
jgi:hypothetical protein